MARLFFAVWPDASAAASLATLSGEVVQVCGGRPVPSGKMHLTLAFLGEVEAGRMAAAADCARLPARRFRLDFDRIGSFRRARVAWAGSSSPARELLELQKQLAERLSACGFELEDREYTPHVTLARRIQKALPAAAIAAIAWRADALTLVRSEAGTGRYTVVERWELGD